MKLFYTLLILPCFAFSQFGNAQELPKLWTSNEPVSFPTSYLRPNKDHIEELINLQHASYIVASGIPTDIHFSDFQLTKILPNGDKLYHYQIASEGALGYRVQFDDLQMDKNARIWLYDKDKTNFVGSYNASEIHSDRHLLTSVITGPIAVIEILEPKNSSIDNFRISTVHHFFRGLKSSAGFKTSGSCMINVACSEGNNYYPENFSTCKILVKGTATTAFSGYCSGTLMNNTSEDGTPYVLTANHCSEKSVAADLADWEYHFVYQSATCATPILEPTFLRLKGSTAIAYSGADNGDRSSDFLLVKISAALPPASTVDLHFMGWDRSNTAPSSGACIHHPDGDIKKISTYTIPATIESYKGIVLATHLQVFWDATANGRAVTQGGSSGSGLLNAQKLLVGTLTGGASDCGFPKNLEADFFGRLNKHWNSYGTAAFQRVDIYLDPVGGGTAISSRSRKLSETVAGIQSIASNANFLTIERRDHMLQTTWNHPNYAINVYNLVGQNITHSTSDSKQVSIDLSAMPKGIYLVEVVSDGNREVKKIVW